MHTTVESITKAKASGSSVSRTEAATDGGNRRAENILYGIYLNLKDCVQCVLYRCFM